MRGNLGDLVFETIVPRTSGSARRPYALPVLAYDPTSKGAQAYRAAGRRNCWRAT